MLDGVMWALVLIADTFPDVNRSARIKYVDCDLISVLARLFDIPLFRDMAGTVFLWCTMVPEVGGKQRGRQPKVEQHQALISRRTGRWMLIGRCTSCQDTIKLETGQL
jgi:hypothetical protein